MAVSGAEMAESEYVSVEAVETVEPTSYGGGAPADFDARAFEDWDEAEEKAGDDESATEAPVGVGMYKGGGPHDAVVINPSNPPPLYAQADDDDDDTAGDDDSAIPVRKDEINVDVVTSKIKDAKDAKDHVKIEQQVIDEGIEDADDLNDELAKILEELRREQGLEDEEPYVSPTQQFIDPIMEGRAPPDSDLAGDLERALREVGDINVANRHPEDAELVDKDAAAPPDQDEQAEAAAATEDDP